MPVYICPCISGHLHGLHTRIGHFNGRFMSNVFSVHNWHCHLNKNLGTTSQKNSQQVSVQPIHFCILSTLLLRLSVPPRWFSLYKNVEKKEMSSKMISTECLPESALPYEMELLSNPDDTRAWLRYIESIEDTHKLFVMARAAARFPRSYKFWMMYLRERVAFCIKNQCSADEYTVINSLFEQALVLLHKMPVLWQEYLVFLMNQPNATLTRRTFNRCLRALPVTQHDGIWKLFLEFADKVGGITCCCVYWRYLKIAEDQHDLVLDKLLQYGDDKHIGELLETMITKKLQSSRSNLDLWLLYIDYSFSHGNQVEQLIHNCIKKFPDQSGSLYVKLANYYLSKGQNIRAKETFEKGIENSYTVRDFTRVYDAYIEHEESVIAEKMENEADALELELRMENFERLMDQRPFLINDVYLRQNVNNVQEWLNRVELHSDTNKKLETFQEATAKIDPLKVDVEGAFGSLWIQYALTYDGDHTREVFSTAVNVPFKYEKDLVEVWIAWCEFELIESIDDAINVIETALKLPPNHEKIDFKDSSLPPQARIHKSIKLWSFYLDLVESNDEIDKTASIYEKIFALKIASPLTVINYAAFLQENQRFEQSFAVYERGLKIFPYFPVAFEIWNVYLTKAIERRLSFERMRDLFEQAVSSCPDEHVKPLYVLYSKYEQDQGNTSRSLKILRLGAKRVHSLFELLLVESYQKMGLDETRSLYSEIIDALPAIELPPFVTTFIKFELQDKAYPRVRQLFNYGTSLVSVKRNQDMWDQWEQFELQHGNKDTYKDMLRHKRDISVKFKVDTEVVTQNEGNIQFVKSSGPVLTKKNEDEIDLDI